MATAKRKQEELGEECDDQEPHDNDPCSDDDDAKRPRLDLHHQHISHHQLPHHRQWSHATGPGDDPASEHRAQREHTLDACASDKCEVTDTKELVVEKNLNSISAQNFDNERDVDHFKGFVSFKDDSKIEKCPFNYTRNNYNSINNTGDRNLDNSYYFNVSGIYPEYLVPRTFCKESSNDDAPCDLSNWQERSLNKFEQNMADNDREIANTSESVDSEHETLNNSENNVDENVQQPINFAYYHF